MEHQLEQFVLMDGLFNSGTLDETAVVEGITGVSHRVAGGERMVAAF